MQQVDLWRAVRVQGKLPVFIWVGERRRHIVGEHDLGPEMRARAGHLALHGVDEEALCRRKVNAVELCRANV